MNLCPKEDRLELWKCVYARDAFFKVQKLCQIFLDTPNIPDAVSLAISESVAITYMRPFKQKKGVRLSKDIVPEEFFGAHNDMEILRDKCFAHKDTNGPTNGKGHSNQFRMACRDGGMAFSVVEQFLTSKRASELIKLSDLLITKLDPILDKFHHKHIDGKVGNGVYIFRPDSCDESWLELINHAMPPCLISDKADGVASIN